MIFILLLLLYAAYINFKSQVKLFPKKKIEYFFFIMCKHFVIEKGKATVKGY